MKRLKSLLKFSLLAFIVQVSSQTLFADGGIPPTDDERVKKLIKKGDDSYERNKVRKALNFYNSALKEIPENPQLNYKAGICYIYLGKADSAHHFFDKAYKTDRQVAEDIKFFLARSKQLTGNYNQAEKLYGEYLKTLGPEDADRRLATSKYMKECKNAGSTVKKLERIKVINLGDSLNTEYPEYGPCISANSSMLVFTARRPDVLPDLRKTNMDYELQEDIYISHKINDTLWTEAEEVGFKFNRRYNNAAAGVSPDGKMLFLYNNKRNGNVYYSTYKDSTEEWSKMRSFGKGINTRFHESSVTMTEDKKTIYFISDRKDGSIGKNDIWTSRLVNAEKFEWSEPVNLGSIVNTPYDEESLFVSPDGNTLYFSSKGHNTIGGYDIFKTEKGANGKWTKPENIGMPINTPEDDVFFSMQDSVGYYATVTPGGKRNFDIYSVKLLPPEPDTAYYCYANLYSPVMKAHSLPDNFKKMDTLVHDPIKIPMFGTIHFDFDKDRIKDESQEMLNLIADFLEKYPDAKIKISGHTDNVGSYRYNLALSKRRAAAAVKFLSKAGINQSRTDAQGYSFSKPIDTNKTAVGRAVNRRVEFEIIMNEEDAESE